MTMKIWIDDIRNPPDNTWIRITSYKSAIFYISESVKAGRNIDEISFDHDLGDENEKFTGYGIAKFIEMLAFNGKIGRIKWNIHSANPVGRANIENAMKSAERYWN